MNAAHSNEPTRHPTLYFQDGDIAVTAMLPNGSQQLYRVDRTFLSRYSSVFEDMLSMPAPQSIETVDDVPVVHLLDDAQDVSTLLETLYNPSYVAQSCTIPTEPNSTLTTGD